ncbi:T9SS type A sorting domain-containing protein [Cyclobacterium qasimii]|nr:T9SS type A sorting domain-containing protein [Cyclobacterium qasimii]
MKKIYCILSVISLLILLPIGLVYSQGELPDNKGKEFWLMFNRNLNDGNLNLGLNISGDVPTAGKVVLPNSEKIDFFVTPGTITTVEIPSEFVATIADSVERKGIQVIAENEIAVFGYNQKAYSNDAFLGLPVDVLGNEYLIMSYRSNYLSRTRNFSVIGIVAVEDNTSITIVPSITTLEIQKGVPFQITLQKGETYQMAVAYYDLTGSTVTSDKPIAVFSGYNCGKLPQNVTNCEHVIEQLPPVSTLGQNFFTVPLLSSNRKIDVFRIAAIKDGTKVNINGNRGYSEAFSLNKGQFKEISIPYNVYSKIESNQPILVAQYSKEYGYFNDNFPELFMMLIEPFEQFQNKYTFSTGTGRYRHYINLVVPISQKDKIELDGNILELSLFNDIPGTTFAVAQLSVTEGVHHLSGNLPFGVSVYGRGRSAATGSYGYPGGQSLAKVQEVSDLVLDQETQQGNTYCFNSIVTDKDGLPVFGVRVDFEVQGLNEEMSFAVTNEQGIANFCFDALSEGKDTIIASIGSKIVQAFVDTTPSMPDSVLFSTLQGTVSLGEEICLTSQVLDQYGAVMEGVEIQLAIEGKPVESIVTNENGIVEFCKTAEEDDGEAIIFTVNFEGSETPFFTSVKILNPGDGGSGGDEPISSSISLANLPGEVQIGEEVCLQSLVLDQNSDPFSNAEVSIVINGKVVASILSDDEGIVDYCLTTETLGDLEISAYYNGGDPVSATIKIIPEIIVYVPTTISIVPNVPGEFGEETCIKLKVLDQFGSPMSDAEVFISKNEVVVDSLTTNEEGMIVYCIDTSVNGYFRYSFSFIETVQNGTIYAISIDSNDENDDALTSFTLLENEFDLRVGEEVCLEGIVFDKDGIPSENRKVSFVRGYTSSVLSDANGKAKFCWTPVEEGDFVVPVYIGGEKKAEAHIKVEFNKEDLKVESFWFVDTDTNVPIREIKDGDKIPYSLVKDKLIALTAITNPGKVGKVKLEMEELTQCPTCPVKITEEIEKVPPYTLFRDDNGKFNGHAFIPGYYKLSAIPYALGLYHFNFEGIESKVNFEIIYDGNVDSFTLVNATHDTDIQVIRDGDVIDLSSFRNEKFNFRANVPLNQTQGGVGMELSGPVNFSQFEKVEPLALFTDVNGDYTGKDLPDGKYTLSATAYPFKSSMTSGIGGEPLTISFEVFSSGSKVDKLILVNADTDKDIMVLMDGSYIDLNQYQDVKLNIRAEGKGEQLAAMVFQLSGAKNYNWTERKAPYAIFGDSPGLDYNGKYLNEGNYKLMVRPYNNDNSIGESLTVNFTAGFNSEDNLRINGESMKQLEVSSSEGEANNVDLVEALIVYPQPSKNFVNILYPSFLKEDAMVLIYKSNGQLLHGGQIGNTSGFEFKKNGAGLYLILVNDGNRVISKKVIIN